MHSYTVRRGESAQSVSEKFGVPKAAILRENHAPFYEGQQVTLPVSVLCLEPAPKSMLRLYYQIPETSVYEGPCRTNIIF